MPNDTGFKVSEDKANYQAKPKRGRPRTEDRNPDLAARAVAIIEAEGSKRLASGILGVSRSSIGRILERNPQDFGQVKQALTRTWSLLGSDCMDRASLRLDEMSAMQLVIAAGIASDKIARLTEAAQMPHGLNSAQVIDLEVEESRLKAVVTPTTGSVQPVTPSETPQKPQQ